MWREAYASLRERADQAAALVTEAAAGEIGDLPFAPAAVRSFVTTGIGSSASHAALLAHLLSDELGLPARFASPGTFVSAPPHAAENVLIVFSQGLSPNARLALADPRAWRAVVLVTAVTAADPAAGTAKLDAMHAVRAAGGLCVTLPGGLEYGALLRFGGPLAGYAIAYRLAAAIGRAAGLSVERLALDVTAIGARMHAAAAHATAIVDRDPLAGRVVFVASGGYGDLAANLSLKVQEGLFRSRPEICDLVGLAHGAFQGFYEQDGTLLMLQRHGAALEPELLRRLESMLDPGRHRLVLLPSELPGARALFEHEAMLNELLLAAIAARQIDQGRWPGRGRERPLYDVATPATCPSVPAPPAVSARRLESLTWPELDGLLRTHHRTAVLPLGATEQHGPHLPFATDTWIADALAARFCAQVDEAVALPVLPIGCSSEHAAFPGTLSLSDDALAAVLVDVVGPLAEHGFETVFIFSAHGGNNSLLRQLLPQLREAAQPAQVIAFTDLDRLATLWQEASAAAGVAAGAAGHHAGEFETSILLALRPDTVRRQDLAPGLVDVGPDPQAIFYPSLRTHSPSGVVGDPRPAAAARAESYLGVWVEALIAHYRREKNAQKTTGT